VARALPVELEALEQALAERLRRRRVALTPAERSEALCMALGVASELSAAAAGVSVHTVRDRRRRIARKLGAALTGPAGA
jgi:DNA-binding CsgD family transcriptional regulator